MNKEQKVVLDVCCGSKMFWFDKNNKSVLFLDNRKEKHILCDGRKLEVSPDIVMDFTNLKLPDNHFKLVVFDPPHLKKLGKNSWMAKKYGVLSDNWQEDFKKGFNECWRVLEKNGVLIFRWNERDIKVSEVLKLFKEKPLLGHPTRQNGQTIWLLFLKS